MEKIVITIEEMAEILKAAFSENGSVVTDEYCRVCKEMHQGCPVGEEDDKECPHEDIEEYRFFVRQHFKDFIVRHREVSEILKEAENSELAVSFYISVLQTCWQLIKKVESEHLKDKE